ncbi:30S ribosomal protein S1 [Planctopirus hydrillae]|uniref:30S ribosomal protein S1 n=1 Tax=Planctopirus hydrillae TaxID=1841610 RepID=A0A1C3E9X5_9PLAN|nr:S1 RNA-binding domain-containing protein [Planctopirus hydrillae]ODA30057.1 30S ribosomal protein S1 [Planctopirus hydrillae]
MSGDGENKPVDASLSPEASSPVEPVSQAEPVSQVEPVSSGEAVAPTELSSAPQVVPGDSPVASAPAAETVSPETAPASEEPAEAPRKRVELNPTLSAKDGLAIPTYAADGQTPGVPQAVTIPQAGPVEIPRTEELDPALEAELAAAMSGGAPTVAGASEIVGAGDSASVAAQITSEDQLAPGMKLKAKVQSVSPENTFVDLGFRSPGMLPTRNFPQGKPPHPGEEHLVIVEKYDAEQGLIYVNLTKSTRRARGNWDELQKGQIVEAYVTAVNKGGLEVAVGQIRAFLPASQVELGFVSSMDAFVGKKFPVEVTEVNPAKRNLVVSRKAILIAERKEAAASFWDKVEVGQKFTGTIKTIKDYGAFVDLGGVDGFLHVGEMSWTRIKHPSDCVREQQTVDVVVLSLDREKQKIGLGMRQLVQNPWNSAPETYAVGKTVSGKVTRITDFGAFIELEPGVEGMIHISELDYKRVKRVADVLKEGQQVDAQVLEIQPERQRISLSVKALKPKPEVVAPPKDEDLAPGKGQQYERKRKEPLRGGTTGNTGSGGLFGDPNSFR